MIDPTDTVRSLSPGPGNRDALERAFADLDRLLEHFDEWEPSPDLLAAAQRTLDGMSTDRALAALDREPAPEPAGEG